MACRVIRQVTLKISLDIRCGYLNGGLDVIRARYEIDLTRNSRVTMVFMRL